MKTLYILLAALSLSLPSYGLNYVVPSGQTETDPIILANDLDQAIIEQGGTLSTGLDTAVEMQADDQTTQNMGTIETTGDGAHGVEYSGDNAEITNSGTISTLGVNARGIQTVAGDNAVLTNSGTISTLGDGSRGMQNFGANGMITNSGLISTEGNGGAAGIVNFGADTVINNSGTISTLGPDGRGINNQGANTFITNSGLISTAGPQSGGIINFSDDVVITNSGTISALGIDSAGIYNDGENFHLINSGTISSAQSFAIESEGSDTTFTLLQGSNIQGPVRIVDVLNLNIEKGFNLALTLTDDSAGFGTLNIDAPYAILDNTIVVIDRTGFAMQADVIADLSDTVLADIYRHRFDCCNPCGCELWAQALGSWRERGHNGNQFGYKNWQGGFILGYNKPFCTGRGGLFVGASFGNTKVAGNTQKADTNSYFAGLTYEKCFCDTVVGVALAAGYIDWDNTRYVMNNLAKGGIEGARADLSGAFVSPELTVSRRFESCWGCPVASFTLRYAGFFPGSYSESGSIADLSVKDRNINLLTPRFEIAAPFCSQYGDRCWSVEPYVGIFGRYQFSGNRVSAELLGQQLDFDQGGPRNLAALLVGFRGIKSFGCMNLFLDVEASFDNERSSRVLGNGGVSWNF